MPRSQKFSPLSEAQLEVMNVIWDHGDVTVSQLLELLERDWARNTVHTVLSRLVQRGWLISRREGNKDIYRAAVARRDTQKRLVRKLIDAAFAGSAESLVRTLLNTQPLSAAEIERIQQLINQAKRSEKK